MLVKTRDPSSHATSHLVTTTAIVLGLVVSGCIGAPPPPPQGDATGSSTGAPSVGTSDGAETSSGGTTSSMTETGSSSTGPAATHPLLEISENGANDFGMLDINASVVLEFEVTNAGDGPAMEVDIAVTGFEETFAKAYENCPDTLAADESCTVGVRFSPTRFGDEDGTLTVSYGALGETVTRPLLGTGVGITENLVINGGGENDGTPPPDWPFIVGNGWTAADPPCCITPQEGLMVIGAYHMAAGIDRSVLEQRIDVGALTRWGDGSGLTFILSAYRRGESDSDDAVSVELHFLDAADMDLRDQILLPPITGGWDLAADDGNAPTGTQKVAVHLICERDAADNVCLGYFDQIEVRAQYSGRTGTENRAPERPQ